MGNESKMSKKNKNNRLTRQGVRDLNHIKGKSLGIRLLMPPIIEGFCDHPNGREDGYGVFFCRDCGYMHDTWAQRYVVSYPVEDGKKSGTRRDFK
jgi:hypothetical protein